MAATTGPFPLDGVQMPTWLLRFDKHGACTSPATRELLLERLRSGAHSDLILFSHGWNNDFDDAAGMYARFLQAFEAQAAAHPIERAGGAFAPVFVGVVWPSIWLSFDSGPAIAAHAGAPAEALADSVLAQTLAERVAAVGGPQAAERLYALLALPRLDDAQAHELATLAAPAFGTLADDETETARATGAAELFAMLQAMQQAEGGAAAPVRRPLDDWGDAAPPAADEPQAAGLPGFLDPRQALRLFSVYQMKDRAGVVGAHGVAALLRELLGAAGPAARVHAVGHSYGCKVVLSAVCAPPVPARALDSLLLLQPAVSHLCFADLIPRSGKPGGYRGAFERVRAPVLCTYSKADFPLHETFHLALRRDSDLGEQDIGIAADTDTTAGRPPSNYAALGGYGPRRAGQRLIDPMPAAGAAYPAFDGGEAVIGLDGSRGLIGSHGDITSAATAWALHRLIAR
ncbi:hypothetical protein CLD22_11495 [Rubrivivax gelatinosus]|nr:hypothetical protein [Rubrivivax gelatinosus]